MMPGQDAAPPSVVVIGDATLDVSVSPAAPMAVGSDVPAAISMHPGGQGANVAIRLARQGVAVSLVCALADDAAGEMIRAALRADGVALAVLPAAATGLIVVMAGEGGERSMLSHRAPIPPGAADAAARLPDRWLVVSGYVLLQANAPDLARRLAALPGRRVLLGCAVSADGLPAWREAARELRADLVVANREEAHHARLPEVAPVLAITAADGAEVRIAGGRVAAATSSLSAAVDTTGAGDAFAARLLSGVLDAAWPPGGARLQAAVEDAVALASAVTGVRGAQARVPGEREATLPA